MIYTYFQDPGHGWIRVPMGELTRLSVKPSRYSYTDGRFAYLEEDCDAAKWIEAKKAADEEFTITETHSNHDSFIRSLDRF